MQYGHRQSKQSGQTGCGELHAELSRNGYHSLSFSSELSAYHWCFVLFTAYGRYSLSVK